VIGTQITVAAGYVYLIGVRLDPSPRPDQAEPAATSDPREGHHYSCWSTRAGPSVERAGNNVAMRVPRIYVQALATIVRRSAIPYGYTITIWTSGAVLEHAHRKAGVPQAYLFLLGAAAGYGMVGLLAWRGAPHRLEPASGDLLRTGAINVVATGLALGSATLVAKIPGTVAWPTGSFVATATYLLVAGVGLALAHRGP
jgi:hypothetical protein